MQEFHIWGISAYWMDECPLRAYTVLVSESYNDISLRLGL